MPPLGLIRLLRVLLAELVDENLKKRLVIGRTSLEVTRTGAVTELPESSLVLFDKDGKVFWKTP